MWAVRWYAIRDSTAAAPTAAAADSTTPYSTPDVLPVKKISPIEENAEARRAYERYYGRTNSFWAKAKRRIKRTLHGDFGA